MARRLGAREDWLLAVRHEEPEASASGPGSLDDLEPAWIVAVRYAEIVNQGGHGVTDEIYQRLSGHWDEGEIVEINMVIGLFAYFNRFNNALRVEVTR